MNCQPCGRVTSLPGQRFFVPGPPEFNSGRDYRDDDSREHHSDMDCYERVRPEDLQVAAIARAMAVWPAATRVGMISR